MTAWIVLSALIALPGLGPATRPNQRIHRFPAGVMGTVSSPSCGGWVVGDTSTGVPAGPPSPVIGRSRTLRGRPCANHRATAWIGRLGGLYADLRRTWRDGAALPPELPLRDYPRTIVIFPCDGTFAARIPNCRAWEQERLA